MLRTASAILPPASADTLAQLCVRHIAASLTDLVCSDDLHAFNVFGALAFNADVRALEAFADGLPSAGLRGFLAGPRQLAELMLLTASGLERLAEGGVRQEEFSLLPLPRIVAVLGKYRDLNPSQRECCAPPPLPSLP